MNSFLKTLLYFFIIWGMGTGVAWISVNYMTSLFQGKLVKPNNSTILETNKHIDLLEDNDIIINNHGLN